MDAHNLVQGSAHGLLNLYQLATASSGEGSFGGGQVSSALEGENPGDGDLRVDSLAYGGAGGTSCTSLVCNSGIGGDAVATAEGRGAYPSAVEVRARAFGGNGGVAAPGALLFVDGGSADSRATALGAHDLFARAEAGVGFETSAHVEASAARAGAIAGAHAELALAGVPSTPVNLAAHNGLTADAGVGTGVRTSELPVGFGQGGTAQLYARPLGADAADWLQGNPNASLAAADGVLAIGSLVGVAALQAGGLTLEIDGSAALDLTAASFAGDDTLAFALLNPIGSFDYLELELSRDGQVLFQTSRSGSAADLDDLVVNLGPVANSGDDLSTFTLRWKLDVTQSPAQLTGFALSFAFLGAVPLPEPSAALLALLGLGVALRTSGAARAKLYFT